MTISEAMGKLDYSRPANQMEDSEKLELLSELDQRVFAEIISVHEGAPETPFEGYSEETDGNTQLLIPEPYSRLYLYYLESELDYRQGEIERQNNSSAAFNQMYAEFAGAYNRTHMPVQKGPFFGQEG